MKTKSIILIVLVVLVLGLPLYSQGAKGDSATTKKGPVELVYMTEWEQFPEFNAYFAEKGKEFAKLYPEECSGVKVITIPYSGYEAKFTTALGSDSSSVDFFKGLPNVWAGQFDYCDPMPKELADRLDKELADYLKPIGYYDGVRYGYPVEAGNFQQLYINVDMFEEVGLDPNKPPKTFDELLEYAKKLTKYDSKGNITVAGFPIRYTGNLATGVADKNITILHAFGGRLFDPVTMKASGFVNSEDSIRGLEWIKSCIDNKVTNLEIGQPETAFGQGRAAMILRESWIVGWLQENAPNIRFKVYPCPSQKEAVGGGNLAPWSNLVYSKSPNKELAWKFLDFMLNEETDLVHNMKSGMLPVFQANYDTEYVKQRLDYESVKEVVARGAGPAYDYYVPQETEVASEFGNAVLEVLYGQKTPKQALDDAAIKMDALLAEK